MSLKEMALAVKLGASVESVAPPGADVAYLKRLIERYIKSQADPRRKRRSTHRRRAGRNSRRTNYAAQVVGRATAELVERVNMKDEVT